MWEPWNKVINILMLIGVLNAACISYILVCKICNCSCCVLCMQKEPLLYSVWSQSLCCETKCYKEVGPFATEVVSK